MLEKTKTLLRDIREERRRKLSDMLTIFENEKNKQLLLLELPFEIDVVSLMEMWGAQKRALDEKTNTPILGLINQWMESGKDVDERRNRRNAMKSLIKARVLLTGFNDADEFILYDFIRYNSRDVIMSRDQVVAERKRNTKETYKVAYGSLMRFLSSFLYGDTSKQRNNCKPLKRGIRALELSEVALIFDDLELQALKCDSDIGLRDLLAFRLMLYAGESIDIRDILRLERKHIDAGNQIVRVKNKSVKCSKVFMKLLRSYLGSRRRCLFSHSLDIGSEQDLINKRLSSTCARVGVTEDVFPQCVQRSLIYILKKEGVIN